MYFVLDTLSSKNVTVIVLEPYVPIGYVCYRISYDVICVHVGSSSLVVVVLGSWPFVRLLFDECSERIVGRGQAR